MRLARTIAGVLVLMLSAATAQGPSFVGEYRLVAGPDMAGELSLTADGHFRYALGGGALDERAAGRWVARDGRVLLYTEPRPRPAQFAAGRHGATRDGPLKLLVTWPNGRGIAGVDFTIGFDKGDDETGYTQTYGWTMSPDEHRTPRWIELVEPIHGIASPRFAIDRRAGNALTFVLTPNDLGVADFEGTPVERVDGGLVMHQRLGDLRFVRQAPDAQ